MTGVDAQRWVIRSSVTFLFATIMKSTSQNKISQNNLLKKLNFPKNKLPAIIPGYVYHTLARYRNVEIPNIFNEILFIADVIIRLEYGKLKPKSIIYLQCKKCNKPIRIGRWFQHQKRKDHTT